MQPAFLSSSMKLRACALMLVLALMLSAFTGLPCAANEAAWPAALDAKPVARQIAWNEAPYYIQEQIKNVVLNCTEGTLTPDKARIFEYAVPDNLSHYVYDYTAWDKHPLVPHCQNSPSLCGPSGCLMLAYTQIKPDVFKQSLRTYILNVGVKEITQMQPDHSMATITGFEMQQSKHSCRLLNGGAGSCTLNFTWKDNKFTYFGFGHKDDHPPLEPQREKAAPPEEPVEEQQE